MAKLMSVVEAEKTAQIARATGKYASVGVYKHMPPDNRVHLSAQRKDSKEWISIYDDLDI